MFVALGGALCILLGIALTAVQLVVSIRQRRRHRDATGDPWNGRTLEWSIPSPPAAWNFTQLPAVQHRDAFWSSKRDGNPDNRPSTPFIALHLPRNSPTGIYIAVFTAIIGFALIWRIYWLAGFALAGAIAVVLVQAWKTDREVTVPVSEIEDFERAHLYYGGRPAVSSANPSPDAG
jgi:cytochrome o ubiquinol oxidase subunit 1